MLQRIYKLKDSLSMDMTKITINQYMRSPFVKLLPAIGVILVIFYLLRGHQTIYKFHSRPKDVATFTMSDTEAKALKEESGLYPLKSRGATIFVDSSGGMRIPPADIVAKMEFRDLEELYHRYLTNIQTQCKRQVHIGHVIDGGYEICEDEQYAPPSTCLMYSIGTANDISFDVGVRERFGCEIHCFDPSTSRLEQEVAPGVHFHPLGLGDKDEVNDLHWTMRTLKSMRQQLGHSTRNIDILKIDIESAEWKAMPNILTTGQLKDVKQLIFEFHSSVYGAWFIDRTPEGYRHYLGIFRQIYDQGFRLFAYRRWNADCCLFEDEFGNYRTGCHEAHFLKVQ